jgi:hypothetical protein
MDSPVINGGRGFLVCEKRNARRRFGIVLASVCAELGEFYARGVV